VAGKVAGNAKETGQGSQTGPRGLKGSQQNTSRSELVGTYPSRFLCVWCVVWLCLSNLGF
jgi:hypothetical protein